MFMNGLRKEKKKLRLKDLLLKFIEFYDFVPSIMT